MSLLKSAAAVVTMWTTILMTYVVLVDMAKASSASGLSPVSDVVVSVVALVIVVHFAPPLAARRTPDTSAVPRSTAVVDDPAPLNSEAVNVLLTSASVRSSAEYVLDAEKAHPPNDVHIVPV